MSLIGITALKNGIQEWKLDQVYQLQTKTDFKFLYIYQMHEFEELHVAALILASHLKIATG